MELPIKNCDFHSYVTVYQRVPTILGLEMRENSDVWSYSDSQNWMPSAQLHDLAPHLDSLEKIDRNVETDATDFT